MNMTTPVQIGDQTVDERKQHVLEWFTQNTQYFKGEDHQDEVTLEFVREGKLPPAWIRPGLCNC